MHPHLSLHGKDLKHVQTCCRQAELHPILQSRMPHPLVHVPRTAGRDTRVATCATDCCRKHLPLGPGHGIGLSARCSVASALAGRLVDLRPVLGLQYEMGAGAAMWAGDQFDLRQKLRLTRNLALEVCHSLCAKKRRLDLSVGSEAALDAQPGAGGVSTPLRQAA